MPAGEKLQNELQTKADILTGKQPPAFTPESSLLSPAEMSAKCR